MPRECLAIIESKSKVCYSRNKPVVAKVSMNTSSGISPDVAELKDMVKALLLDKKSQNQSPATVKAVDESFNYNQGNTSYRPPMMSNQILPPGFPPVPNNQNAQLNQRNNQNRFIQNQNQGNNFNHGPVYQPPVFQPPAYQALAPQTQGVSKEDFLAHVKANDAVMRNIASTSSSGTLPRNTIANLRSNLKAITTRSGVSYDGPQIPPSTSFLPKVVENEPEATKDTVQPTNNGSTEDVQPYVVQSKSLISTSEPANSPISEPVAYPVSASRPNLRPSIPYPSRLQDQKLRDKANNQQLADHLISRPVGVAEDVYVKVGSFRFSANFVVVDFDADPRVPLILGRSFIKTERALIDVFEGELTLRVGKEAITFNLDQTLRYSANYNDMTEKQIDVIDMACKEYSQEVLGLSDVISSGNPTSYYDPIFSTTFSTLTPFGNSDFLLEEVDAFLAIKDDHTLPKVNQSYLDPEGDILLLKAFLNDDLSLPPPNQGNYLPDVELKDLPPHLEYAFLEGDDKFPVIIAKDLSVEEKTALITVLKSHKQAIAWKLFDIKGGFTVVENEDNELIMTRLVTGWRVCIDYRKLNEATRKDHFPLPFIDPMLERLAGNQYYCFLDGFSGYFQIPIDLKDQEKTTFTCPYEMFAYRHMPFGICNAPGTFQSCLSHLERMLKRCEDTNLCLNWEMSHFMVKEGIVLGHKISKQEIEVDKAKVDVIIKLPRPTTIMGIQSFLGHAGFYRRKLTKAPILIAPDWDMPFELMCDASDFAIGAVLRQRQDKHFMPIHYAAYKTPIGCTPYKLVYRKACHLPIELEHRAHWALKHTNFDLKTSGDHKKVQLNELRDQAYENSLIYKEKTKRLHDSKIKDRVFNIGDRVLLFNSQLKIFFSKLKSRWSEPFTISQVYPYGTVELSQPDGPNFKVNGHRLKHYFGKDVPKVVVLDLQTFPRDH
nr:reverse transcriptase domain-containing protein [Tanacetum cinerariifolium]